MFTTYLFSLTCFLFQQVTSSLADLHCSFPERRIGVKQRNRLLDRATFHNACAGLCLHPYLQVADDQGDGHHDDGPILHICSRDTGLHRTDGTLVRLPI